MSTLRENVETTDKSILLKNRRFVGVKETVAYVLEATAQSLNIEDFKDRYIYDVIKIDFSYLAIQNIVVDNENDAKRAISFLNSSASSADLCIDSLAFSI